jgi:hypothetical protein
MARARDSRRPRWVVNLVCYVVGGSSFVYLMLAPGELSFFAAAALAMSVSVWQGGQPCRACGHRADVSPEQPGRD